MFRVSRHAAFSAFVDLATRLGSLSASLLVDCQAALFQRSPNLSVLSKVNRRSLSARPVGQRQHPLSRNWERSPSNCRSRWSSERGEECCPIGFACNPGPHRSFWITHFSSSFAQSVKEALFSFCPLLFPSLPPAQTITCRLYRRPAPQLVNCRPPQVAVTGPIGLPRREKERRGGVRVFSLAGVLSSKNFHSSLA